MKATMILGGILLMALGILYVVAHSFKELEYYQTVGGHLKRAADANSVDLAAEELDAAIKNIESKGWTSGSTAIFFDTPATDVKFWYTNLSTSRDELASLDPDATQLEKTNVMMKLRETLMDHEHVTAPSGIALYPSVASWTFWGFAAAIGAIAGFLSLIFGVAWKMSEYH